MVSMNFSGLAAARTASDARRAMNASMERLATGKRINRASDDPAGTVAVTAMDAQRKTITARIKTFELQALAVGARDGALAGLGELVGQLDGLVVAAANRGGMGEDELAALQTEADSILGAIDTMAFSQAYRGELVLQGWDAGSIGVSKDGEGRRVSLKSLAKGGLLDLSSGDLETAQRVVKDSLSSIATARAEAGAGVKGVDAQIRSLQEELINLTEAQSEVEDVDYASEVSEFVRRQVLTAAADFVMKMTMDLQKQGVLSLLGAR
jgi:flagellin